MSSKVTVCICTYGDPGWTRRAEERALPSAEAQTIAPDNIIISHANTLSEARNGAAKMAATEYLIFLDADDELDRHYVAHMIEGTADIRQPSTLGVVNGVEDHEPVLIPKRDLLTGNFIVIGAMVNREKFLAVGGFREFPVLEDWDLWIRLALHQATFESIPEAIYRVHVQPNSRNQQVQLHRDVYMQITREFRGRGHEIKW